MKLTTNTGLSKGERAIPSVFCFWQITAFLGKTYFLYLDQAREHFVVLKNYVAHWGAGAESKRDPSRP